jgi:hypothetical protein
MSCSSSEEGSSARFTKEQLKTMLIRENELRLSESVQKEYAAAEVSGVRDWMNVTEKLQENMLLKDFSVEPKNLQAALLALRSATHKYPDLKPLALYVKYNRAEDGKMQLGDSIPNIPLISADYKGQAKIKSFTTPLLSVASATKQPLIIFAGSVT